MISQRSTCKFTPVPQSNENDLNALTACWARTSWLGYLCTTEQIEFLQMDAVFSSFISFFAITCSSTCLCNLEEGPPLLASNLLISVNQKFSSFKLWGLFNGNFYLKQQNPPRDSEQGAPTCQKDINRHTYSRVCTHTVVKMDVTGSLVKAALLSTTLCPSPWYFEFWSLHHAGGNYNSDSFSGSALSVNLTASQWATD